MFLICAYVFLYAVYFACNAYTKSTNQSYKHGILIYHAITEYVSLLIFWSLYILGEYVPYFQYTFTLVKYTFAIVYDPDLTQSSKIHHICVLLILAVCYHQEQHQLATNGLAITSVSTPFIATSKVLRGFGHEQLAKLCFVLFTVSYIYSRLIMFPIWVCMPIYMLKIPMMAWIASNWLAINIYILQLFWMKPIIKIFSNQILLSTPNIKSTPHDTP